MRKRFLTFIVSFVFFFLVPSSLFAHPIDELGVAKTYDQKQILEIHSSSITLSINLTFYSFDKVKVWESIDKNKDKNLSDEEKTDWMQKGQNASYIKINDHVFPCVANSLLFPDSSIFLSNEPADVTIISQCGSNDLPDLLNTPEIDYVYKGKDKTLEEIDFTGKGVDGISVTDVQKISSDINRMYLEKGNSSAATLQAKTSDRLNHFLNTYVKPENLTLKLIFIALISAFFIGSLHALTPGHGKALVAGYLVGEKGTIKHAIQLGSIMTITHTSSVFVLGLFGLLFTQYALPIGLIKNISFGSALFILLLGIYLLISRLMRLRREYLHMHEHPHDHNHSHTYEQTVSFKTLLTLGISGGIVPCIDALVILLIAITLHKVLYGIVLLLAFSLGLASTLTGVGILCVIAKQKTKGKISFIEKLEPYSGVFSACVIIILAIFLLISI
jgi:nickel/cobalt exporter